MCQKCDGKYAKVRKAAEGIAPSRIVVTSPDGSQEIHDSAVFACLILKDDGVQVIGNVSAQFINDLAIPALEIATIRNNPIAGLMRMIREIR